MTRKTTYAPETEGRGRRLGAWFPNLRCGCAALVAHALSRSILKLNLTLTPHFLYLQLLAGLPTPYDAGHS